jgi:hypothetical protein
MRVLSIVQRLLLPSIQLLPRGLAGQAARQLPGASAGAIVDQVAKHAVYAADQRLEANSRYAWELGSRPSTFALQEWLTHMRQQSRTITQITCSNVGLADAELAWQQDGETLHACTPTPETPNSMLGTTQQIKRSACHSSILGLLYVACRLCPWVCLVRPGLALVAT